MSFSASADTFESIELKFPNKIRKKHAELKNLQNNPAIRRNFAYTNTSEKTWQESVRNEFHELFAKYGNSN